MNKNELTKRIAETTPLNQKEVASAIDAFIDIVKDQLASGEKFS